MTSAGNRRNISQSSLPGIGIGPGANEISPILPDGFLLKMQIL